MKNSYKKIITPLYIVNIVIQAFITLISPIVIMLILAYLAVKHLGIGSWIYVVLILLGVFSGLYSMVVFILTASRSLEAIDNQNNQKGEKRKQNEPK
ncbi:MAG: AtpZ/AtpI family protein [Clostridia bacterium]|nr:AtpZ/AtpI family protein [Clostridia bacterium]